MGRAIDMLKKDVAQLKTAFDGLASTVETLQDTAPAKKNIDLHKVTEKKVSKKKEVAEETT